jgi:hypothetical protein
MKPKQMKKLWHSLDLDGNGDIRISEFAAMLFPEIEDVMDEHDDDDEGQGDVPVGLGRHVKTMRLPD